MTLARGTVLSVNVGRIREFDFNGQPAVSAIWKAPATGRVAARGVNLEGDDQADRGAPGEPDTCPLLAPRRADGRQAVSSSIHRGRTSRHASTGTKTPEPLPVAPDDLERT